MEDRAANVLSSFVPVEAAGTFKCHFKNLNITDTNRFYDVVDEERNGESTRFEENYDRVRLHQYVPRAITQSSHSLLEWEPRSDLQNPANPTVIISGADGHGASCNPSTNDGSGVNFVGKVPRGWTGRRWFADKTMLYAILFCIARNLVVLSQPEGLTLYPNTRARV